MKLSTLMICSLLMAGVASADDRADFEKEHRAKIEEVKTKLTLLHGAMLKYLVEHEGVWPQLPEEAESLEAFMAFWQGVLEGYGVGKEVWKHKGADGELAYIPSNFDARPLSAFRWKTQPWFNSRVAFDGGEVRIFILPEGEIWLMPFDSDKTLKPGEEKKSREAEVPEELEKFRG